MIENPRDGGLLGGLGVGGRGARGQEGVCRDFFLGGGGLILFLGQKFPPRHGLRTHSPKFILGKDSKNNPKTIERGD